MKTKIQLCGDNLVIKLPKNLADSYNINIDDVVELLPSEDGIIITKQQNGKNLKDLLADCPPGSLTLTEEDKEWINGS